MSKQYAGRNSQRKKSAAKSLAGSAVGTVFNIVLIAVAVMLIYRFSVSAYQYGVRIYGEPAMSEAPGTEVTVTVEDGKDFKGLAEQLYEKGLIRDKTLFYIQELLSNYSEDGFTEGTYTLTTAMTPDEMMDVMGAAGEE
ncbi:MAG: solute-binding protein [Eubacteriales bacterium]|nr:solute-binding protein [Eubacteriales bacterium]